MMKETFAIEKNVEDFIEIVFQNKQSIQLKIEPEIEKNIQINFERKEHYDFEFRFTNYYDILTKKASFYFIEKENLNNVFKIFLLLGGCKKGKTSCINIISEETILYNDMVKGTSYPSLVITNRDRAFLDMKGNNELHHFFNKYVYDLLDQNKIKGLFTQEFEQNKEKKMLEKKITTHFLRAAFIEKSQILFIVVGVLTYEEQLLIRKLNRKFPSIKKIVIHNLYQLKSQKEILCCIENDIERGFNVEKIKHNFNFDNNLLQFYYKEKGFDCDHVIFANNTVPELAEKYNKSSIIYIRHCLQNLSGSFVTISELKKHILEKIDKECLKYFQKKNFKPPKSLKFQKSTRGKLKMQNSRFEYFSAINFSLKDFDSPKLFTESYDGDSFFFPNNKLNDKKQLEYLVYVEKNQIQNICAAYLLKVQIFCNRNFEQFEFCKPILKTVWKENLSQKCLQININKVLKKKINLKSQQLTSFMEIKIMEFNNIIKLKFEGICHQHCLDFDCSINTKDEQNKIYTYIIPIDDIDDTGKESFPKQIYIIPKENKENVSQFAEISELEKPKFVVCSEKTPPALKIHHWFAFNEEDEIHALFYSARFNFDQNEPFLKEKYKVVSIIGIPLLLNSTTLFNTVLERDSDLNVTFLQNINLMILSLEGISKPIFNEQNYHDFSTANLAYWDLKNKNIQDFALNFSDLSIFCFFGITDKDQENLYQIFDSCKNKHKDIVIIHYLKNVLGQIDSSLYFEEQIKRGFLLREDTYDKNIYETTKSNKFYYTNVFPEDQGFNFLKVVHLIMADNDTEIGKFYNPNSVLYLRNKISILIPKKNPLEEFELHLKTNMENNLMLSFQDNFEFVNKNNGRYFEKCLKAIPTNFSLSALNINEDFHESTNFVPEYELIHSNSNKEVIVRIFFSFNKSYYQIQTRKSESNKELILIVTGKKLKFDPQTKILSKYVLENRIYNGDFELSIKIIGKNSKINNFVIKQKDLWTAEYLEIILVLIS